MELWIKLKHLIKTRSFKIFLIAAALYWIGLIYFILAINPDISKTPEENIFNNLIWIIYWRWNLDLLIIAVFGTVVFLETIILDQLKKKFSDDFLSIYLSPIITMCAALVYMLTIDVGVTFFADVWIDGTWESPDIVWLGLTAQQLYHTFFFWFIPIVIITGVTNQVFIRTGSFSKTFRAFCVLMAIYSLNLALLDPIVCQVLWNDWSKFEDWNTIFAEGWIAHYILFCVGWFVMDYFIKRWRTEIELIRQPKLRK